MSMNKVILQGRLTTVPELKQTPSGLSVVSGKIAVDRKTKEKETDFIPFTAWRSTAEFISKYFDKGSEILLCGQLNVRTYEKDGKKQTAFEVVADEVSFCGSKQTEQTKQTAIPYIPTGYAKPETVEIEEDEDLPF